MLVNTVTRFRDVYETSDSLDFGAATACVLPTFGSVEQICVSETLKMFPVVLMNPVAARGANYFEYLDLYLEYYLDKDVCRLMYCSDGHWTVRNLVTEYII